MSDETIDPADLEAAARVAADMMGQPLAPLSPEEVEAKEARLAELALIRGIERWERQQDELERQRQMAEREAAEIAERHRIERERRQQEIADRTRAQQTARASQEAAQRAAQTQSYLLQQERERRQRLAIEQQRAFFRSLGPMGNEPQQPSNADVMARLDQLSDGAGITDAAGTPEPAV